MVYSSKIPQGNQRGTDTQDPMLQNFTAIKTFIDTNHVTFGDPNQGKHSKIVMPVSTSAPTTIAAEVALFAMMSNASGAQSPEMSFRGQTNALTTEFTSGSNANFGWARLPSGLLLKWYNDLVLNGDPTTGHDVIELEQPLFGPKFTEVHAVFLSPTHAQVGNFTSYVKTWDIHTIDVWSTLRYGGDTGVGSKTNVLVIGI